MYGHTAIQNYYFYFIDKIVYYLYVILLTLDSM